MSLPVQNIQQPVSKLSGKGTKWAFLTRGGVLQLWYLSVRQVSSCQGQQPAALSTFQLNITRYFVVNAGQGWVRRALTKIRPLFS